MILMYTCTVHGVEAVVDTDSRYLSFKHPLPGYGSSYGPSCALLRLAAKALEGVDITQYQAPFNPVRGGPRCVIVRGD